MSAVRGVIPGYDLGDEFGCRLSRFAGFLLSLLLLLLRIDRSLQTRWLDDRNSNPLASAKLISRKYIPVNPNSQPIIDVVV